MCTFNGEIFYCSCNLPLTGVKCITPQQGNMCLKKHALNEIVYIEGRAGILKDAKIEKAHWTSINGTKVVV